MKITTSFLHLEHTPALDAKIFEASEKFEKFFHGQGTLKWSCYVKNGQHFAEVYFHAPNFEFHAKASSDNMYHSIDLAVEKIEKQMFKMKQKFNKMHRKSFDMVILDPEMAWTDMPENDEDVA